MSQKKITIDTVEPLLLYGSNDVHLKKIESFFPDLQLIARGNQLILKGEEEDMQKVEKIFGELMLVLHRNKGLTENDVETVLSLFANGKHANGSGLGMQDAILFTPGGEVVKARTQNQNHLVEAARKNDLVFAVGPAGTGKTYTAVALAVAALKARHVKKIVLSRPAVEAGERLGFLPGDFREKVDPYLRPLYDALEDMIASEKLATYLEQNIIEIVPLAYMRGRTLNSSFLILDEAQNATSPQMKMFLTRLGANSRAIITGDITQTDLPSRALSGLIEAQQILAGVDGISFIHFDRTDVLRHRLVKDIIDAYDSHTDHSAESAKK